MSTKHLCSNLTPTEGCTKTCCPDYKPDTDWCKAFNKRTLEQIKETTQLSIDGMWFNIEDAKNTIGQAEQYLAIIYELLIASLDQVMKASSSAARTEGDFESASVKVKQFVNEIHILVGGAQYNGRHLFQDSTTALRGTHHDSFKAGEAAYSNFFPQEDASHLSIALADVVAGPVLVFEDTTGVLEGDYISGTGITATHVYVVRVDSGTNITVSSAQAIADAVVISFTTSTQFVTWGASALRVPNDLVLNDSRIYGDSHLHERSAIHYRLAGPRGACRNVGSVLNDFVYELPPVGAHSLGLTSFTSEGGQDYHKDGLNTWTDNDGIIGPDGTAANADDVDETVSDFNCAIKKVGVELDKLRAYRYLLCLREKQIRIWKAGQDICFKNKCKI